MSTYTYTFRDLCRDVAEEVREMSDELRDEPYPEDTLHEIVDGSVPVYTSDILAYADDDNSLATDIPDIGPAFGGEPTPTNIIAANIYERLSLVAHETLQELREEWENLSVFPFGEDDEE